MWTVYLQYEGGEFGRTRNVRPEEAAETYDTFQDSSLRKSHGVSGCWVMNEIGIIVLGTPPAGWTPDSPARET